MSQQPELPAETPPPVPPAKNGKGEIVVSGNEIYLPESATVRPGDPEFAAIVAEVLPEYAPSLSEEARGYPVWAILLILVFLGSLTAGLYWLRPQPPVPLVEDTTMEVPPPKNTGYSGEFSREYRKAMELVKEKKYEDARKCLEPVVDLLLARWEADPEKAREEEPKNEPVFYSYFALFNNLPWDDEAGMGERARDHLDRLIRLDSDYRWKLFEIQYQLTRMGGERPGRLSRHATVASLYKIMGRIDDLRKLLADDPKLTRQLDLYKCHFDLKVWRKRVDEHAPDDEWGVGDREEVLKISSRYPNDIPFRKIRIYLMETLRREIKWKYRFNGEDYYSNAHLEKALMEEREKLRILEGKR